MTRVLRAALYTTAALASLLGLWGILANLAIPLMPAYGDTRWDFFGPFERWDESGTPAEPGRELRIPWWAISFQTPCPYLDPLLAGPVGYGFYALCLAWGVGTVLMLRSWTRPPAGRASWPAFLLWLGGLAGIVAHLAFFAAVAREAARAGLTP